MTEPNRKVIIKRAMKRTNTYSDNTILNSPNSLNQVQSKLSANRNFHLSLPCLNLQETIDFYKTYFKCKLGRQFIGWADINLYGNEITFVQAGEFEFKFNNYQLDKSLLPSFHFGIVLDKSDWNKILKHIKDTDQNLFTPSEYFVGQVGHHKSYFVEDPNGYMVELKCFENSNEIFKNK